jgi:NAD(P)-dependent dehydrogenase (short-subunit alcohol dehydrogenase family)
MLSSFGAPLNVAVAGSNGGIGQALHSALATAPNVAHAFALSRAAGNGPEDVYLDIEDEASIAAAAQNLAERVQAIDLVVVATGILHDGTDMQPEKALRMLDPAALERAFRVNATGPALVAKHFLPLLPRDRKAAFAALSARVGSISDNGLGGWYAYRASKSALNMLIRNMSIELARRHPMAMCVGLHPGTVDTRLSAPFQRGVSGEKLFTPVRAAGHLIDVLDRLDAADTGGIFAWDGQRIPE